MLALWGKTRQWAKGSGSPVALPSAGAGRETNRPGLYASSPFNSDTPKAERQPRWRAEAFSVSPQQAPELDNLCPWERLQSQDAAKGCPVLCAEQDGSAGEEWGVFSLEGCKKTKVQIFSPAFRRWWEFSILMGLLCILSSRWAGGSWLP